MASGPVIRTAQVAKHLGISSRELKEKVLEKVNFGIHPNEREIPFAIAQGIVRYAARVLKISCPPLEENTIGSDDEEFEDTGVPTEETIEKKEEITIKTPQKVPARSTLSTLEALRNIGNLSQNDQARKKEEEEREKKEREEEQKRKEEAEERRRKEIEERRKKERENNTRREPQNQGRDMGRDSGNSNRNNTERPTGNANNYNQKTETKDDSKGVQVFRKIEISKEEAEEAKKRKEAKEEERRRRKEEEEALAAERKLMRKKRQEEIFTKKEGVVELPSMLSVKEFAEKIGVPIGQVITSFVKNGMMTTITQTIDFDTACIIAEELGVEVQKEQDQISSEDLFKGDLSALLQDEPSLLTERPPVVAVVGHVDHGKTSILDAIRTTKVVDKESGGITQHIGAYSITKNGRNITFLDTPGHEAFTSMRARGAKTADIVILVVAADDGVKPQTIEAINHAKAANAAIIVAANKIDKEAANLDRLRADLSENGIQVEEWGGTIPMVPVSALTKKGIDELLEMIFLQADVLELKANPKRPAVGTVIESHLDPGLGPVATILVNTGTMRARDLFVVGGTWGRVKSLVNENGKTLKEVLPSEAARIAGMTDLPSPGDVFQVVQSEKELKQRKQELEALKEKDKKNGMGMIDIMQQIRTGNMKTLNLVVKTDTIGSLEAISQALKEIGNDEVSIKIIHSAAGSISENDVMMASASKAIIIAFHTTIPSGVRNLSEKEGVDIRKYEIIYNIIEEMTDLLEGLLEPEIVETIIGKLRVKGVFYTKGKKQIVGGKVEMGYFEHPCEVSIYRAGELIGTGRVNGIQHFENKVKRIESPQECGLQIDGYSDNILEDDIIEAKIKETILRKLEK